MKRSDGFSLIEILVVLVLFGVIGVIISQSVLTTLRGAKRSDSESKVRSNVDYAIAVMERHLHNARTVSCPSSERVEFVDQRQQTTSFFRQVSGTDQYIASASANQRLTSRDILITTVTFTCTAPTGNVPATVTINLTARDNAAQGIDRAEVTTTARVMLRTSL